MEDRKLKILAIDDVADNLIALRAVLGFALPQATILTAPSGLKGLELALKEDPDVVLLDIAMPGMDGFEVCRRLKADERLQDIPVVFLTVLKTDRNSRIQALEAGGEAFLTKPANEQELVAQIQAMAKLKAAHQVLRQEKQHLSAVATERTRQLEVELAERRRAEAALRAANLELEQSQLSMLNLLEDARQAEATAQAILSASTESVFLMDAAGTVLAANATAAERLGLTTAELLGQNNFAYLPPTLAAARRERVAEVVRTGRSLHFEDQRGEVWMANSLYPIRDEAGQVERIAVFAQDISARKRAEEAARRTQVHYQALVEHAPDGVVLISAAGAFKYASRSALRLMGFDPADLHQSKPDDLTHPDDLPRVLGVLQQVMQQPERTPTLEYRFQDGAGKYRWVESTFSNLLAEPSVEGIVINFRDITERRAAAAALQASEERFRQVSSAITNVAYSCRRGPEGEFTLDWVTGASTALLGLTEAELIGLGCWKALVVPESLPDFLSHVSGLAPNASGECELQLERRDGTRIWVASYARMVPIAEDGGETQLFGALVDITARKRAEADAQAAQAETARLLEEAEKAGVALLSVVEDTKIIAADLRVSEARLRSATEAAQIGTWELHLERGTLQWSPMLEKFMGFAPGKFPGTEAALCELMTPESRTEYLAARARALAPDGVLHAELCFRLPDGKERWGLLHGRRLSASGADADRLAGVDLDISDRKRMEKERQLLEAQMQQQQRLESIGTLASGVAHEINNPINGVMNYAQLILDQSATDPGVQELASEIIRETKRVATIVRNLLQFARHEKQSHSPARITDIIEASLSLMRVIIKRDQIELRLRVPADLPLLKCRSQQVQQVIMNLVTNARDALNTRFPKADPAKFIELAAELRDHEGRRWIRVTVADSGGGIPAEVQGRIFDPFFTTKSRTQGTGLGLAISHGIVKDHHGHLHFETVIGEGTRFHLDLPVDNGWELPPAPAPDPTPTAH